MSDRQVKYTQQSFTFSPKHTVYVSYNLMKMLIHFLLHMFAKSVFECFQTYVLELSVSFFIVALLPTFAMHTTGYYLILNNAIVSLTFILICSENTECVLYDN